MNEETAEKFQQAWLSGELSLAIEAYDELQCDRTVFDKICSDWRQVYHSALREAWSRSVETVRFQCKFPESTLDDLKNLPLQKIPRYFSEERWREMIEPILTGVLDDNPCKEMLPDKILIKNNPDGSFPLDFFQPATPQEDLPEKRIDIISDHKRLLTYAVLVGHHWKSEDDLIDLPVYREKTLIGTVDSVTVGHIADIHISTDIHVRMIDETDVIKCFCLRKEASAATEQLPDPADDEAWEKLFTVKPEACDCGSPKCTWPNSSNCWKGLG